MNQITFRGDRKVFVRIVFIVGIIILALGGIYMGTNILFPKYLFGLIQYQTDFQREAEKTILKAIDDHPEGQIIELARLTPFEWDRVCIFGMGRSHSDINQALNIHWLDDKEVVWEDHQLFVFVKDEGVVQHLLFSHEVIMNMGILSPQEICLPASEAVFIVGGYTWFDMRLKRLLLPESLLP